MIKNNKSLLFGSIFTVALLTATFFAPAALATATPTTTSADADAVSIEAEAEALGVEVPGNFYFLKNWGYSLQKAFTFNPVKKAEIDLKQASEQIVHARQLASQSDDANVQAKVKKALDNYEVKIAKIGDRAEELKADNPELAEKFLDKLSDRQIKQQEIMSKLEEKMPEEAWQHLNQVRERTMEHYGEVVNTIIDDKEKISDHLLKAFDKQNESDFNRLKHVEILKALEDKVPEEEKAAIMKAQANVLEKFKAESDELPAELRELNYMDYMEKARAMKGNALQTLEELSDEDFIPANLDIRVQALRDEYEQTMEAAKKGLENLTEEEKAILERAKARTMQQFEAQKQEYEQIRNRLENSYEAMPPIQKEMLDQYKERADIREEHMEMNDDMIKEPEMLRDRVENMFDKDDDNQDDEEDDEDENDEDDYMRRMQEQNRINQ
ncbi:MAG: DUF5667 domain-containing protein [Candidatus Komeilibacteria bacterium]